MARILFVMRVPSYLRLFGDAVRALAERGHEVLLAYDRPDPVDRGLVPRGAPPNVRVIGFVPEHGGPWRPFLDEVGKTIDYVRFLSPELGGTPYLRGRMDKFLPPRFESLRDVKAWPASRVRALSTLATWVDRATPVDPALVEYVRAQRPDAVVVTPVVLRGAGGVQQTQFVKAVRRLGIPVGLAVGSWDHLSSKGLIRVDPDLVMVWNNVQKDEAVRMHRVPAERVVVTGAHAFDQWFRLRPTVSREDFLRRVGLPVDKPFVLYAGSSRGIAQPKLEHRFVRKWITALRASRRPALASVSVLIRPHPGNFATWDAAQLAEYGAVSVWPRTRPMLPMNDEEIAEYFHTLYYSAAIVGINTSAMIEATILDRPVLTIETAEFASTQAGTTHFHYLTPEGGGCVITARRFTDHLRQLRKVLAHPKTGRAERRRFVEDFVRPNGIDVEARSYFADAVERLITLRPTAVSDHPLWLAPARATLRVVARRWARDAAAPERAADAQDF